MREAGRFVLSLPEVTEEPHFEKASFRVRGKIIATVPTDGEHLHIFGNEDQMRAVVATDPGVFEELWWGKRFAGVRVNLAAADADADVVFSMLEEAWRQKASKKLIEQLDMHGRDERRAGYSDTAR